MATIVTRAGKGAPLTHDEVDANFDNLNNAKYEAGDSPSFSNITISDKIIHSGDTDTAIRFPSNDTVTVETAGSERMRIDSSGNVGIGTSSPAAKFHVNSGLANLAGLFESTDAGATITLIDNSTTGGSVAEHGLNTVGNQLEIRAVDNLAFETAGSERMRIDSSGNLLVGTTTANGAFTVQSNSGSYTIYTTAHPSNGYNIACRGVTATGVAIRFLNASGADVGSIDYTSTATSYTTSSDYRLKEDVQPMVGASDRVLSLNPVNFAWKADGSRTDGFIAHEVQAVAPQAVTGVKDGEEMQAIDHSKLVPLLTAALQEALTKIEALEARITALEA